MADVSPALLEDVERRFRYHINQNRDITAAVRALAEGTADYVTAYRYAQAVGVCLSNAFQDVITEDRLPNGRMYMNIANKVVRPMLLKIEDMVASFSDGVQELENQRAGIGLKPVQEYEH